MRRLLTLFLLIPGMLSFQSCESTLDYGYYVPGFDADSIYLLFEIADAAIYEKDFKTYSSLLGPNYMDIDNSDGPRIAISRIDYLNGVHELFESSDIEIIQTSIIDIEFAEDGQSAEVRCQQELRYKRFGQVNHSSCLYEVVVGFEDNWIFIKRETCTAKQIIEGE